MRCYQVRPRLTLYIERMCSASEMAVITQHIESCPSCSRQVAEQHRVKSLLYQVSDVETDPLLWTEVVSTLREQYYKPFKILLFSKHSARSDQSSSFIGRTRYMASAAAVLLITIATIAWYVFSASVQQVPMAQDSRESDDMSFYLKDHALHADESVFSDGAFGAVMVNNSRKH